MQSLTVLWFVAATSMLGAAMAVPAAAAESAAGHPAQALFGDTHVHTGWSADALTATSALITGGFDRFSLGS